MTMRQLPSDGFLRLNAIIGDPRHPHIMPVIPVSRTTWYEGIKDGSFPPPVHIRGIPMWRVSDIRRLIDTPGVANDRLWTWELNDPGE